MSDRSVSEDVLIHILGTRLDPEGAKGAIGVVVTGCGKTDAGVPCFSVRYPNGKSHTFEWEWSYMRRISSAEGATSIGDVVFLARDPETGNVISFELGPEFNL